MYHSLEWARAETIHSGPSILSLSRFQDLVTVPDPMWVWLENTKAGPRAEHVQREKGTGLLYPLLATAPQDGRKGQDALSLGALEIGLFSIQVGWWLLSLSLGLVGDEKEPRLREGLGALLPLHTVAVDQPVGSR